MTSTSLQRPLVSEPQLWTFPTPRRATLANGLEVIIFDLPGQHVITGHLVLDIPLSAEDRAREGVATLTARTLDEGSQTHSGEEFAELLETEGAGFGIDLSLSGIQAMMDVPASRFDRALGLFAEAIIEPSLADADIARHVQLRLAEIEQAQANSAQTASIAFRNALFAEDSRASRMNGGSPDTVATVTGDHARQFHQDHFGPSGSSLILAGDFGVDPLQLVEQYFGNWANPTQQRVRTQLPQAAPRKVQIIDRSGSVQADVRFGGAGIDRHDPRWADITVASYAMGGAFLSRLNAVLREDRGYTYGVRMQFAPMRQGGTFAVQGSFRTEVVADALSDARQLLDLTEAPLSLQEVQDAVTFFSGVSPLRYATADGVADQAATQALFGLDDNYVNDNLAALRRVTPDSATEAYCSLVNPDEMTLVVVGEASAIADKLSAAGFDDLEITG